MSALASEGVGRVSILAHDRPELIREAVGTGERWGLQAEVLLESRELTPAAALLKYAAQLDGVPAQQGIVVLDHFPGWAGQPLFVNYGSWFATLCRWMPCAVTANRVGFNETSPSVWKGCHSQVSPRARLRPPCWIGEHVFIGANAVIGPRTIVEDGSFIEPGAELVQSWIGPETFVGRFARIRNSLAWASSLVNWRSGSATQLADPFLLCALRQPHRLPGWFKKLSDAYARNKGEAGLFWKHLLVHKQG